ncbi:MAG TPA: YkvA family protein [Gemmatimonadaceae bacterium]
MRAQSARSRASSRKRHGTDDAASARTTRTRGEGEARSRDASYSEPPTTASPRTGAKRTVMSTLKDLPNFLRLLGGLLTDRRVSNTDKLLVAGAIAYILLPMDFIPDYIPFLGEVDDLFVLVLALQRLIANAGRAVLLDHWMGDPRQLRSLDLERVLVAAAFFLPRRLRRRLRTIGRDF